MCRVGGPGKQKAKSQQIPGHDPGILNVPPAPGKGLSPATQVAAGGSPSALPLAQHLPILTRSF